MYEERVPPVERPGPTVVVRSLFLGTRRGGDGCLSRSLWLLQRATISQLLLFIIIAVATRYYYCSWSLLVHNIGIIYYFFLLILLLLLSLHLLRYDDDVWRVVVANYFDQCSLRHVCRLLIRLRPLLRT